MYIQDYPQFRWRGLLVDTARQYLPTNWLFHILDGMAYQKLNVLHWHLSDGESFPFQSKKFPEIGRKCSYSKTAVYTYDDIKLVVEYARERGIRVVPEFDTPGHSAAIGRAFPDIVANCWDWIRGQLPYTPNAPKLLQRFPLDISNNRTFGIVTGLLEELADLFPDKYFHLGGDQVRHKCWEELPHFNDWMRHMHFVDRQGTVQYVAAEGWYMNKLLTTVKTKPSIRRQGIVWEESLRNNFTLPPGTIVHIWEDPGMMRHAYEMKIPHINSWGWYLDRQAPTCVAEGGTTSNCPTHWTWASTWEDLYQVDPYLGNVHKYMLGGEAAAWGENLDQTNFDDLVFSRLPAISERLWRKYPKTDSVMKQELAAAQYRLASFRCKLAQRGIRAAPVITHYCDVPEVTPSPARSSLV